jgi:hypothetical protein
MPAGRTVIKLVVTLDVDNSIKVEGPTHDKVLCYGMLEWAKEAISEFHRKGQNVEVAEGAAGQQFLASLRKG